MHFSDLTLNALQKPKESIQDLTGLKILEKQTNKNPNQNKNRNPPFLVVFKTEVFKTSIKLFWIQAEVQLTANILELLMTASIYMSGCVTGWREYNARKTKLTMFSMGRR